MKKLIFIVVLCSSFLMSSCGDELKDLLDVKFNTTITEKINVAVVAGTNPLDQSVTLSLDNADTNKYLNKLKTVEIKKMTYKIVEFAGDPSGVITANLQADGVTLHTITNKIIKTEYDNGTIFEVTNKEALVTAATSLLQNKTISLKSAGQTVANSAMSFKIEVTLELGIVANPL